MKRAVILAVVTMIGGGCATFCPDQGQQPPAMAAEASAPSTPGGALAEADKLLREGKYADAEKAYRRVPQEHPGTAWVPLAQYALATLLVSPDNPQSDYASGLAEFENFISLYPQHERAAEARSWRQAIKQILDTKKENVRLKSTIEKLQKLDLKQEEKRSSK